MPIMKTNFKNYSYVLIMYESFIEILVVNITTESPCYVALNASSLSILCFS